MSDLPTSPALLPAIHVLFQLGEPTRLAIVRALARGERLSVVDLAKIADRPADQVAKHLKRLRDVGILVASTRADDTRQKDHEIPAVYRVLDANGQPQLDFGSVVLRLV
jgi:DNA-binding transcriptional ArsR family regulator